VHHLESYTVASSQFIYDLEFVNESPNEALIHKVKQFLEYLFYKVEDQDD